jgi:tRNA uridine 5-carbamoylmethylation protein Kti12
LSLKRNFLVCLTGLPSAGKSTLANELKEVILERHPNQKVKIIDPDIIRTKLTGDTFDPEKEETVRQKNLKQIKEFLKSGYIVISDDLNYYSSMRHDLREIANKANVPFLIIYVSTPLETCLKWNKKRGFPIPNEVIHKINEKFDDFDKYEWDTPDIVVNLSNVENRAQKVTEFADIIKEKLQRIKTEKKRQTKPKENTHNLYHERLDAITRDTVSQLLKDHKYRKKKSKILAARKRFVKKNLEKEIPVSQITKRFKDFLQKHINGL